MQDNLSNNLHQQKEIYDKKSHGCPYHKGDSVWLFNPVVPLGKSKKFHRPWTGPYTIVKQLSDSTYQIQHTKHHSKRCIVHCDHLKACNRVNPLQCKDSIKQSTQSSRPTQFQAPTLQIMSDGHNDNEDRDSLPMACGETQKYPAHLHHPLARLVDFVCH